jgi:hypothetical protein
MEEVVEFLRDELDRAGFPEDEEHSFEDQLQALVERALEPTASAVEVERLRGTQGEFYRKMCIMAGWNPQVEGVRAWAKRQRL